MNPLNVILISTIACLISFGWTTLFDDGHIFGKIGAWLDEKLPTWLSKPLYGCVICNSFHVTTALYWFFIGDIWYVWIAAGLGAVGLASAIIGFQNKLKDIADVIEDAVEQPKEIIISKPLADE